MILPLDILYEDEFILALNKAPCTHSVMQAGSIDNSVAYALTFYLRDAAAISAKSEDSGLLQRLDFETSGVLLAARNSNAWHAFHELNIKRGLKKKYYALVEGNFQESLSIQNYLGNPNRRAKKVRVYAGKVPKKARALPAETHFRKLQYLDNLDVSLVEALLETGRRHQIRAHAAFSGHPLLGDLLYGSSRCLAELFQETGISLLTPKFFLHAGMLGFIHPHSRQRMEIFAPLPKWSSKINMLHNFPFKS